MIRLGKPVQILQWGEGTNTTNQHIIVLQRTHHHFNTAATIVGKIGMLPVSRSPGQKADGTLLFHKQLNNRISKKASSAD